MPFHCQERERVLDVGTKLKETNVGLSGLGAWVYNRKCEGEPFKIETFGFKEASHGLKYSSHSAMPSYEQGTPFQP